MLGLLPHCGVVKTQGSCRTWAVRPLWVSGFCTSLALICKIEPRMEGFEGLTIILPGSDHGAKDWGEVW